MTSPKYKIRAGNVSSSVFMNEGKDTKGNKFSYESIVIQRSYKDKEGNWKNDSLTIRKNDLIKLASVIEELKRKLFLGSKETEDTA